MYSMTGYGRGTHSENGLEITVELRSVNNRYLDLALKCPRAFLAYEERVRNLVRESISRGHVDVFVGVNDCREKDRTLHVDRALARAYFEAAKEVKEAVPEAEEDITLSFLLRQPDVVRIGDAEEEDEALYPVLEAALKAHRAMRFAEGERLKRDLLSRMDVIENLRADIEKRAPMVAKEYREKLTARIEELLGGKVDETRILTEAAVYSDKCSIDEELTRLFSHIAEFRKICTAEQVGRKLDFLVQEFNRECNTVCSKSNDGELTRLALAMKNEIEKVREQIQNLE